MKKKLKSNVFNNSIGSPYSFDYPILTKEQEQQILAGLFEQLLIFDKVTISTNRVNFALKFLIDKLGINIVEKLFEHGYIKIMIWSPMIFTGHGIQLEDGSIDESIIYGQPPIVAGTLSEEDLDPEKNIHNALLNFNFHRDRKRIFTRKALSEYIVPKGITFSTDSSNFVIDAYIKNNLGELGLPFDRDPDQLDIVQRRLLLNLGHKVLETAILSEYSLKSYENYEHFEICRQNISNIGKAYNVIGNSEAIFNLEELPNLKQLFLTEQMNFESVFKIRHLSNARYYRKWINEVGENANSKEITKEYLNQIKGNTQFFESTAGKFVKNLGLFGVSAGLGEIIGGHVGAAAGTAAVKVVEPAIDYGLGLLETFLLDNLLKGNNPSMFIDHIKNEVKK